MVYIVKVRDADPRDIEICGSVFEMTFSVQAADVSAAIEAVKELPRYKDLFSDTDYVEVVSVREY